MTQYAYGRDGDGYSVYVVRDDGQVYPIASAILQGNANLITVALNQYRPPRSTPRNVGGEGEGSGSSGLPPED